MRVLAKLLMLFEPLTFSLKDCKSLWVQGDNAFAEGNLSKANSIYRHLVRRRPRNAEDYRYAGLSAYRLNNPEKAAGLLEAGLKNYPATECLLEHYLQICAATGQIDRAICMIDPDAKNEQHAYEVLFDRIVGSHIQLNLIDRCLKRGFLELAERKASQLLEDNPDALTLWRLADILLLYQRSNEANTIYRRLSERRPTSAEDYRYSALSAYRLNNPGKACDLFEAGIDNYPMDEYLLENYLQTCIETGRIDRAICWIEPDAKNETRACQVLFDRFVIPHSQLGLIDHCLKRGFLELAELKATLLLENNQDTTTLWRLADILSKYGRSNEAGTIYRKLSERRPESAEDYLYAALSEYRLNNPEKACDLLEAGIGKYPTVEYLIENYLHIGGGQIDRIIRLIEPGATNEAQACEILFDRFVVPHIQLSLIDHCLKREFIEMAEQKTSLLLENNPDALTLWRLADILLQHKRRNEAEAIYRQLSERKPTSAEDYRYSALSAHRLSNPGKACDLFEAGIDNYPAAEYLLEHFLQTCIETGQIDRAICWIVPDAKNEQQACQDLFERFLVPHIQLSLIDHCLKRGFLELAERKVNLLQENNQDAMTLWRLAEILLQYGRSNDAETIYRKLSKRSLKSAADYRYSALAEHKLQSPEKACDLLEVGIENYPNAGYLLEHYLHFCIESEQIDRVIHMIAPDAENEQQACEILFDRFVVSNIQLSLIDHCLKREFLELAMRMVRFLQENNKQDAMTLWRLAEILSRYERSNEAEMIYRGLSERRPETAEDYYYAGLAWRVLKNIECCLETLERGQTMHPNARYIATLYIQLCAQWSEYDRYSIFFNGVRPDPVAQAKFMLDFYRTVFSCGAWEYFIINFKEIEFHCDEETLNCLKSEFLLLLQKNSQSFQRAKTMIIFSKFLDFDQEFSIKLLQVLQNSCKSGSGDGEVEAYGLKLLHELTPPMVPHYATERGTIVRQFTQSSKSLSMNSIKLGEPIGDMTINFTPWQEIFCLVAPELYGEAISAFEQLAFNAWPRLNFTAPHVCKATSSPIGQKKIRIGFTVHDSMPMMSGLLSHLDKRIFETVYLRPGKAGRSDTARNWPTSADRTVEYSDVDSYSAIETIANQELDIIVSGPSIAAIFFPMMARLAPLQIVLLEPNWTDGLTNADYYISWQPAEPVNPGNFYKSAVSFLQHPPYWIERPLSYSNLSSSDDAQVGARRRLLGLGPETRLYLCANTPPKIHPAMDEIFHDLLERDQTGFLVLLRSEYPAIKTLKIRLREKLGKYYERIIFLPSLAKEDAHLLLQSVDCCLDSYPLCGMSSSFDGAMLGVPIVTLPCDIPFGRWTAAIYEYIGVSGLTAKDRQDYIDIAIRLANDKVWRHQLSIEIKEKSSRYVESKASFDEFQDFIIRSWERRVSGLPPANWLSGRWQ